MPDCNETLIFFDRFSKNSKISNFMKISPVEVELYADGGTDGHDETDSRFSHFCDSDR